MDFRLSSLFHQASKRLPKVPLDPDRWPPEWKTTQFKAYERLPKIPLSRAELVAGRDYFDVVRARRSIRDFDDGKPLNNELLSTLLRYSCGLLEQEHGRSRRSHPSGGGLVPIEIYPLVFSGNATIPAGVYHYNIREHALDVLWHRSFGKDDVRNLFAYPWVEHASFAIVLTAVFERSQIKYGERGYRFILLEAGHIAENFCLSAETLGIKCCPMGGTRDEHIEKLLDIDGITESIVYALVLG